MFNELRILFDRQKRNIVVVLRPLLQPVRAYRPSKPLAMQPDHEPFIYPKKPSMRHHSISMPEEEVRRTRHCSGLHHSRHHHSHQPDVVDARHRTGCADAGCTGRAERHRMLEEALVHIVPLECPVAADTVRNHLLGHLDSHRCCAAHAGHIVRDDVVHVVAVRDVLRRTGCVDAGCTGHAEAPVGRTSSVVIVRSLMACLTDSRIDPLALRIRPGCAAAIHTGSGCSCHWKVRTDWRSRAETQMAGTKMAVPDRCMCQPGLIR